MKVVREYQRREFCRDIECPSQLKLDATSDQAAIDAIKQEKCRECMAHVFHKWLMDRDYRLVIIE